MKFVENEVEYLDLDSLRTRIEAHRQFSEVPEDVEKDVILAVGLRPEDSLLDVGSGTGSFLARVRAGGHRGRLAALDASPEAVAAAASVADDAVQGSATALPFADGEFTVVTARHMLYHVDDPDAAIAEARRVLSVNGRFAAAVNHLNTTPYIAAIVREEVEKAGIVPPVLPGSRVHTGNLPDMVSAVFGKVDVKRHNNALVYESTEGVIRYGVAILGFYGVGPETPERTEIVGNIAKAVGTRFAMLEGSWREPKGYSICIASKV